ncbi:MAG TPA: hypothetical protein VHE54_18575 [Puia sp.]|nr:hypothetical protein [Puia sp.]
MRKVIACLVLTACISDLSFAQSTRVAPTAESPQSASPAWSAQAGENNGPAPADTYRRVKT